MSRSGLLRLIWLRLRPNDAAANYVEMRVAAAIAANYTLIWPAALPATQQAFTVDAAGNIGWQALSGGGGTVTGFSATSTLFDVATPSTTPALSYKSQSQNLILASPDGAAGVPTMRSLVANDIPSLTAAKISNFDTQVRTNRLDQFAAPTANISLNGQQIKSIADASLGTDVPSWQQVQALFNGQDNKASVRAASTANVTIASAPAAIDGVTLANGNRILLKNQATQSENGLYTFNGAGVTMTRATDADISAEVTSGLNVFVEEGTQAATLWFLNTSGTIALGATNLVFTQIGAGAAYTAGNGLQLTGNSFSVLGTANRITVSGTGVDIASTYVGQTSITTLGTIATGTWNGTAIAVANGGTGATTATAARTNLGVPAKATGTFNNSTGTVTGGTITVASNVVTITHNLGNAFADIVIYDSANKKIIPDDTTATSANVLTLDFSVMGLTASNCSFTVIG